MNMIVFILAAVLSAGNAEFDRTAAEGAARITLERAKAELKSSGPAAGTLKSAMLADPGKFARLDEAKRECRAVFDAAAEAAFAAKLEAVREQLQLGDGFKVEFSNEDKAKVSSLFDVTFDRERREACAEQAAKLVSATRPTEADFDAKQDFELREEMLERIVREQKTPVFQENRLVISERMVEPVIQDARREQRRQAEYLMRARCDTFAPSKLALDLRRRLEENVAERRSGAEDAQKAWGVFDGTFKRSVDSAVERRTVERLVKKIELSEVNVEQDEIARTIAADAAAHVKAQKSEEIFSRRYCEGSLASGLDGVCADAPAGESEELRAYLSARLHDARVRKAVDSKIKKEVLPKWREVRAKVAEEQFLEIWPALGDGSWSPAAELADDIAARSDYKKAVHEWRKLAALSELADAAGGRALMEEADRKADQAVAAAFDCARSAIAAQHKIVDSGHKAVLEESRRRKDDFWSRTPDLEAVVKILTEATQSRWAEIRLSTLWPDEGRRPANADAQHAGLFPSVKRKIELIAKVILEEMKKPEPEEKPEEPKPPEEPPPEEPPPEIEELMEFSISVKRIGSTIEVSLEQGGNALVTETVSSGRDDFENAMFKVTKALSEAMKLK